jgi:hypothetical protein
MRGTEYADPHADLSQPIWRSFVEAIAREKRVILTADECLPPATEGEAPGFRRTGYIAVFRVDDVWVEDRTLRFRFTERLEPLK